MKTFTAIVSTAVLALAIMACVVLLTKQDREENSTIFPTPSTTSEVSNTATPTPSTIRFMPTRNIVATPTPYPILSPAVIKVIVETPKPKSTPEATEEPKETPEPTKEVTPTPTPAEITPTPTPRPTPRCVILGICL